SGGPGRGVRPRPRRGGARGRRGDAGERLAPHVGSGGDGFPPGAGGRAGPQARLRGGGDAAPPGGAGSPGASGRDRERADALVRAIRSPPRDGGALGGAGGRRDRRAPAAGGRAHGSPRRRHGPELMERLTVQSGGGAYPVYVGHGLLDQLGRLLEREGIEGRAAIFVDEGVQEFFGEALRRALPEAMHATVPSGEAAKTLRQAERLWGLLIEGAFGRRDVAVSVGGGATSDLVGFVAATYHRGMPVVHLPTTLLAQVDASVGGKTAIDHPLGKNLVGAFHAPRLVLADLETLRTLPVRERWCGLAEVAKAALIDDPALLSTLEAELERLAEGTSEALLPVVVR